MAIFTHEIVVNTKPAIIAHYPDTKKSTRHQFIDLITYRKEHSVPVLYGQQGIVDGKLHNGLSFTKTKLFVSKGIAHRDCDRR